MSVFVTSKEAAEILGLQSKTLTRFIKSRGIERQGRRPGRGGLLYRLSDIEAARATVRHRGPARPKLQPSTKFKAAPNPKYNDTFDRAIRKVVVRAYKRGTLSEDSVWSHLDPRDDAAWRANRSLNAYVSSQLPEAA